MFKSKITIYIAKIKFFAIFIVLNTKAIGQLQPIPDVIEKALQGVVTVAVYENNTTKRQLGMRGNGAEAAYASTLDLTGVEGSGSGFVTLYKGKHYVITNAHVVERTSGQKGALFVYGVGNHKYEVSLVGGDTFYDLAILAFMEPVGKEIIPMYFRETPIRVGEPTFAIGNPLGEYPYTVTDGIVSAKNRVRGGLTGKFGYLQSTATTIWGNSGGPLIDANGKVLGINSQIAFASRAGEQIWQPQLNFALEASIASRLISDIIDNKGLVRRAFLGVEIIQNHLSKRGGKSDYSRPLASEITGKPLIGNVVSGGPADGVLNKYIGFEVKSINGETTRNVQEVLGIFELLPIGATVLLVLEKDGQTKEVKLKSEAWSATKSALLANFITRQWGAIIGQQQGQLNLMFRNPNASSNPTVVSFDEVKELGKTITHAKEDLFETQWVVVAAGLINDEGSTIWRVQDAADLGSAIRIIALSGAVDLVLYKNGASLQESGNLIQKRFKFSENNQIIRETLYY